MKNNILTQDTKSILLLFANIGIPNDLGLKPLTLQEYNNLARWLHKNNFVPADLFSKNVRELLEKETTIGISIDRINELLERGFKMSLLVENWTNNGFWIMSRADKDYPTRLKSKLGLGEAAPPILFGIGNKQILLSSKISLAIVGSRNADEKAKLYTRRIAEACSDQQIIVISGGARGVDQEAMSFASKNGGHVIGVLADNLARAAVLQNNRKALMEGNLTLISPYHPDSIFTVGNAMARNKYIYALANAALIISSDKNQGGTWAGAVDSLKRWNNKRIFVRVDENIPEGNKKLLELGCYPFPNELWDNIEGIITGKIDSCAAVPKHLEVQKDVFFANLLEFLKFPKTEKEIIQKYINEYLEKAIREGKIFRKEKGFVVCRERISECRSNDLYGAILPFLALAADNAKDEIELSGELKVSRIQIKEWLKRANSEGIIQKVKSPIYLSLNLISKRLPIDLYLEILPLLLNIVKTPKTIKEIKSELKIDEKSLKSWIKRALIEEKIKKCGKNQYRNIVT